MSIYVVMNEPTCKSQISAPHYYECCIICGLPPTALFFAVLSYGFLEFGHEFLALWWEASANFFYKHLYYRSIQKKNRNWRKLNQNPHFLARNFPICRTAVNTNIDDKYKQRFETDFKTYARFRCSMYYAPTRTAKINPSRNITFKEVEP